MNAIDGIKQAAERNSLGPAVIGAQRAFTYGEILDLVALGSAHLGDQGLAPKARAAFNIADPIFRLVAALASIHCGAIPVVAPLLRELKRGADYDVVVGADNLEDPALRPDFRIGRQVIVRAGTKASLRSFPGRGDADPLYLVRTERKGKAALAVETYGDVQRLADAWSKAAGTGDTPAGPDARHLFTHAEWSREGFPLFLMTLAAGVAMIRPRSEPIELIKAVSIWNATSLTATAATLFDVAELLERLAVRCLTIKRVVVLGPEPPKSLARRLAKVLGDGASVGAVPGAFPPH